MISTLALLLAVAMGLSGCAQPDSNGPGPAAQRFADAVSKADFSIAARQTTDSAAAEALLKRTFDGLDARSVVVRTSKVSQTGDTATVDYTYDWDLGPAGPGARAPERRWQYNGQLNLVSDQGTWKVQWVPTDIHPNLGANQSLILRDVPAARGAINEAGGSDVVVPGVKTTVKFNAAAVPQGTPVTEVTDQLAKTLSRFDKSLTSQKIAEHATSTNGPIDVATVKDSDLTPVVGQIDKLPGVTISRIAVLEDKDPGFAPQILAHVQKQVQGQLNGQPGWEIALISDITQGDMAILHRVSPTPAPSVSVTLSKMVQTAAQKAVNVQQTKPAMMVVIKPSTGAILAIAQNKAAEAKGPLATTGLFPPGSTFKIVTASQAMTMGLAQPQSIVPCPGEITIGDRVIPNYDRFSLGNVTMERAFAQSCNTSFAKLASEMQPDSLTIGASRFGIGLNFNVAGLPTDTGKVIATANLTERTEDGFGQGKDLTSPFGMALAASTVAHGSMPIPYLIEGRKTTVTGDNPPLDPKVVAGLRQIMRQVVLTGTGRAIASQGQVYGKTGEAEFNGGSHAWFAGYRGDLAFASLIVDGGDSDHAVNMTKYFFEGLPDNYLA